jgi:hypothetical protein
MVITINPKICIGIEPNLSIRTRVVSRQRHDKSVIEKEMEEKHEKQQNLPWL